MEHNFKITTENENESELIQMPAIGESILQKGDSMTLKQDWRGKKSTFDHVVFFLLRRKNKRSSLPFHCTVENQ